MSIKPNLAETNNREAAGPEAALREAVVEVAGRLQASFVRVLSGQGGGTLSASVVSQRLGLERSLCRRLISAVGETNPFLVMHRMPGVHGLRGTLQAAAKHGVSAFLIREAERVVNDFAQLIANAGGSQEKLNSVLSDEVPAMRRTTELRSRAAVYKGMLDLYGHSTDVIVLLKAMQPSERNPGTVDMLRVLGYFGIRKLRRMPPVVLLSATRCVPGMEEKVVTLNNKPVNGATEILLTRFCSQPLPQLDVYRDQDGCDALVFDGNVLTRGEPSTIVLGLQLKEGCRVFATPEVDKELIGYTVSEPAKLLVMDCLVRDDLWRGVKPCIEIHRTGYRGGVEPENYDERLFDRLEHLETLQTLDRGLSGIDIDEVPQYRQIIASVLGTAGWEAERFSGYRSRVIYPVLERQMAFLFDLPKRPPAR